MKKSCSNCMWYHEFYGVCINGNSSFRGGIIGEYGDPHTMLCGHHEEKPSETHEKPQKGT